MKIVHLLHEFPFPPTSGVRCDMGRRLAAFAQLGHRVFAVSWASVGAGEMPDETSRIELSRLVEQSALLPIGADLTSKFRRMWNLRRYASYIAARIPSVEEQAALTARIADFKPDLIWLEGVHPFWLAMELRRRFHVPLVYRAHNIEHRYVAEQARLARSARLRLALTAGTWGLEAAERALHRTADVVYDISTDDLAWWQAQGYSNGKWLAPQANDAILAAADVDLARRTTDLLFLGSLSSPNNVAGLRWYVEAVHPIVRAAVPDITVMVAGRRPDRSLAGLLRIAGISLVPDPPEAAPLLASARVMLNPILHGSGVNIKTIDMLATGCPVVTTPKGGRGLPRSVVETLCIAHGVQPFASAVIALVQEARGGTRGTDRSAMMKQVFGIGSVIHALAPFAERPAA